MGLISLETKQRIAARQFLVDNQDQYEDYMQALEDMKQVSEKFLDGVVQPFIVRQTGYHLLADEYGRIVNVNGVTGHVSFVTELTDQEADDMEKITHAYMKEHQKLTAAQVFLALGWKVI